MKATRKRHTTPERVLAAVVTLLERDSAPTPDILWMLLKAGPLFVENPESLIEAIPPADLPVIRGELIAFVRTLARHQLQAPDAMLWRLAHGTGSTPFSAEMGTYRSLTFSATASVPTVAVSGDTRDLVVLQLVLLLREVGLPLVRVCPAPDCGRMFVKTYRREYCSRACQNREWMRTERQRKRDRTAAQARRRRRTQQKGT